MAELKRQAVKIEAQVLLTLSEEELRALDALAAYGTDAFIEAFYKVMGRTCLEPYEIGLRTFLSSVRNCASLARDAEECRQFMAKTNAERAERARVPMIDTTRRG